MEVVGKFFEVPGRGYTSANATRPGVVVPSNFSANAFGKLFRRKGAPRKRILSGQRIAKTDEELADDKSLSQG